MERLLTLYSEVQSTDVRWLWYEKGLSRASVPPFMGMKRSERSNNMPA